MSCITFFYSDNLSKLRQIETPGRPIYRCPWQRKAKCQNKKKHCSLSWKPLREFTGGVLFLFPQVQLWRSTLLITHQMFQGTPKPKPFLHTNPNHSKYKYNHKTNHSKLVVVSLASGVKTSLQISLKTGKKAEKRWSMCPNLDFTLGDYERCVMATFSRSSDMLIIARSKNFVSHVSDSPQNILPFCVLIYSLW